MSSCHWASSPSDYRDDSSPIVALVTFRPLHFGDEAIRKTVPNAVISYRNPENQGHRNVKVSYAINLNINFDDADPTEIPNRGPENDLSDLAGSKVSFFKYSFHEKKGVYFQVRIVNDGIDESLDVTGVTYRVAGLSDRGVANVRGGQ